MASRMDERKCFNFIWKIENANYFWQKQREYFSSPSFVVNEIETSKWKLNWYPSYIANSSKVHNIAFCLLRQLNSKGDESIEIEWEVSLLATDGSVLSTCGRKEGEFRRGKFVEFNIIPTSREEVFHARRCEFLPQDTLTVSCRIWKSVGELWKDVQWIARTCLAVEKRSFLWKVGHFTALRFQKKCTYEIKSLESDEKLISLELFTNDAGEIYFVINPKDRNIRCCVLELSPVDAFGNAIEHIEGKFLFGDETKQPPLSLSIGKLKEKSNILNLQCMCGFSTGTIIKDIERVVFSDSSYFKIGETKSICTGKENDIEKVIPDNPSINSEGVICCSDNGKVTSGLKNVLINDFKSMLSEKIQSDVQLKTRNKTYAAHKCILSARSTVFKAMFSNNMKEKADDNVDIGDLSDDAVSRMLRYIYSAELEELEWQSAIQLYDASDKYGILTLRDVCLSYLKNNLSQNNACEALVLSDLHQDKGLKSFVQDFIVRQGQDIVFSKEWDQMMEDYPKLAAETMRLKLKKKVQR